jgi:hypothetical protein
VMTFRACSSPAPTPVKLQPAPTILSQESVHTTLSITHHTRKRPSTGPRTTHGSHIATAVTSSPNRSLLVPTHAPNTSPKSLWSSHYCALASSTSLLTESKPQWSRHHGHAVAAHQRRLRLSHHYQSTCRELNPTLVPFVAHFRPHITGCELALPPRAHL